MLCRDKLSKIAEIRHSLFGHVSNMDVEIVLYGLVYECSFVIRNDDCPFKAIDSISFKEKVDWIDNLSEEKKRSIMDQHIGCSTIRMKKCDSIILENKN